MKKRKNNFKEKDSKSFSSISNIIVIIACLAILALIISLLFTNIKKVNERNQAGKQTPIIDQNATQAKESFKNQGSTDAQSFSTADSPVRGIITKNKLSHVKLVRNLKKFVWDESDYYKAHLKKIEYSKQSASDIFFRNKIMPLIEHHSYNSKIADWISETSNNEEMKKASELISSGNYRDAAAKLEKISSNNPNLYESATALSQLTSIYRAKGDSANEQSATGRLAATASKMFFSLNKPDNPKDQSDQNKLQNIVDKIFFKTNTKLQDGK